MKILLLTAVLLTQADVITNRVDEPPKTYLDLLSKNGLLPKFFAGISNFLNDIDPVIDVMAMASNEDRVFFRDFHIALFDFTLTKEERWKSADNLLQKWEKRGTDMPSYKVLADKIMKVTDPVARLIPVFGKKLFSEGFTLFTDERFLSGSRETRKKIVSAKLALMDKKVKENLELRQEFNSARGNEELWMMVKNGLGVELSCMFYDC